jgi:hypothetical protein
LDPDWEIMSTTILTLVRRGTYDDEEMSEMPSALYLNVLNDVKEDNDEKVAEWAMRFLYQVSSVL